MNYWKSLTAYHDWLAGNDPGDPAQVIVHLEALERTPYGRRGREATRRRKTRDYRRKRPRTRKPAVQQSLNLYCCPSSYRRRRNGQKPIGPHPNRQSES